MRGIGWLLCLAACGGDSPGAPSPPAAASACSTVEQNTFVRDRLRDVYLWYHELPDLDPSGSASPEAYLEAVRYRRLDTSFSYIASKASDTAFYSDGQFVGLGFGSRRTGPTELRVGQVFPGSPASEAGLRRGDTLLAVNGRTVPELIGSGEIDSIFGPAEVGVEVGLVWRRRGGAEKQATLRKRLVTIPIVSNTRVLAQGGRRVGYLHFRNFVHPSTAALDGAFSDLQAAGANELVLDLRYNGGGLLSVARHLAGLVGGVRSSGEVFVEYVHNDKHESRNSVLRFDDPPAALDLRRLVVITTRGSASASEAVINGLRPFVKVVVVGDTTYGKPVGQYSFDFCAKVLYPVAFHARNARGEGDYFEGIPADCAAEDDLDHALGDAAESSLAEALGYLRAGRCSPGSAAAARAHSLRESRFGRPAPRGGLQDLVNAN